MLLIICSPAARGKIQTKKNIALFMSLDEIITDIGKM